MEITEPQSEEDFLHYYHLRWKILRQPWGQPVGSEKDELEEESIHLMAVEDSVICGVGRGHLNTEAEAQIRYMAVDQHHQGKGIGTRILLELEKRLCQRRARYITLNARQSAVGFYEKYGYRVVKKAHTLFGVIPHFMMRKDL